MAESQLDDNMSGICGLQNALDSGELINFTDIDLFYKMYSDEYNGEQRFWYAKIVDGQVQVLATFGFEEELNGMSCYSVNYAVNERYRGRGLAVEVVNRGITDLKLRLGRFYVEALIEETNIYSIHVAKKLFSNHPGVKVIDEGSEKPSLFFRKLIDLR